MLTSPHKTSPWSAILYAALVCMVAAGCGSKEVTLTEEELQGQLQQLSPEEQEQKRLSQEAIANTAGQLPTQGLSEQQQEERNEALRQAIPMPPPR